MCTLFIGTTTGCECMPERVETKPRLPLHKPVASAGKCTLTWVWDKHRTVLRCAQYSRGFNRANLRALYAAQDKPTGAGAAINSSGREAQHEIYLSISYTNVSI